MSAWHPCATPLIGLRAAAIRSMYCFPAEGVRLVVHYHGLSKRWLWLRYHKNGLLESEPIFETREDAQTAALSEDPEPPTGGAECRIWWASEVAEDVAVELKRLLDQHGEINGERVSGE